MTSSINSPSEQWQRGNSEQRAVQPHFNGLVHSFQQLHGRPDGVFTPANMMLNGSEPHTGQSAVYQHWRDGIH